MKIAIVRESVPHETRVAIVPQDVEGLVKLGATVEIESGLGFNCHYDDAAYSHAGATISVDRGKSLAEADLVLRIRKPSLEDIAPLKKGTLHVSFLDPFNERTLVEHLAEKSVDSISLEMIPRTSIAQKMDVLSSQSNLGGYAAAVMAAERLHRVFPMMVTPAGTIQPARMLVIGAGVAGLQAIATAKRLGARVEAFDTRPEVEEQINSLGARFVRIDLGETGKTGEGYAKTLTEEQAAKQREGLAGVVASSDVVITTAQVFGKRAPLIVTLGMVKGMKPGSVIVDMATESGGNVEGSKFNEETVINGVLVIGPANLPAKVNLHASQLLSRNLFNLVSHLHDKLWDKTGNRPVALPDANVVDNDMPDDDILRGCLITRGGRIVHPVIKKLYEGG